MLSSLGMLDDKDSPPSAPEYPRPTLLCFSHLRWDFVFQRPQHLMRRFAKSMTVIFWEEPVEIGTRDVPYLKVRTARSGLEVRVIVPHLPRGLSAPDRDACLARLLEAYSAGLTRPLVAWYYTPMMLPFSRDLRASCVVYDAMDELSKFKFAPAQLLQFEQELIDRADIVFTGGASLFEIKKRRHNNVHCFPSSVDRTHFLKARAQEVEPPDQARIPRPRFGFFGVIDERFDVGLLAQAADARPNYQFVMIGPVVKISAEDLPRRPNIHYLGSKPYAELPDYLGGWDVALMPFAMNEATEFISPTKTPEYLAGGRPVVSTPVRDVVRHYGKLEGVKIVASAADFVSACDQLLALRRSGDGWLAEADLALSPSSWDTVHARMSGLIDRFLWTKNTASNAILVAAE